MRAHLPERIALPAVQVWLPGPIWDQGETPRCTAFAWKAWSCCAPGNAKPSAPPDVGALYADEQRIDGFSHPTIPDDSDASGGSSVRAGAKVLSNAGRIGEYVWAGDLDTLARWVLLKGPAVIGSDWTQSMFAPDARGFVKVEGAVVGGHAYLVLGYSRLTGSFLCQNSWSLSWGAREPRWRGCFRMSSADLAKLLAVDGEAVGAVEVKP